jgi:hypothetical protein
MAQVIIDPVRRFYSDRIIVASIIPGSITVVIVFGLINGIGWEDKQAWDWLDVLVFPVVLAVGAVWFQRTEAKRDSQRQQAQQERDRLHAEEQRRSEELAVEKNFQAAALEAYLDQMSNLLVEKELRNSPADSDIRALAQARTLTMLLRLEPARKRHPLKLVAQMHLIDKGNPTIKLPHADLNDANLKEVTLIDVDLTDVDLRGADLTDANLRRTVLADADLRGANLRGADLTGANLTDADLRGARYDAATSWPDGFKYETCGAIAE